MKSLLVALALCLPAAPALAATPAQDAAFRADLDVFLTDAMTRLSSVPALSVAVAHASGPVEHRAVGYADLTRKIPATARTPFYIASSTKAFFGTSMAVLARRGVINLDWTLAELAPDVRFAPGIDPTKITLRHLLSHSHGLKNDAMVWRLAFTGEHDPKLLWNLLAQTQPDGKYPLGVYHYGNVGPNIAAVLIEHRLGRRWQEIVDTEVLRPLGLRDTFSEGLDSRAVALPYMGDGPNGWEPGLPKTDATMQSAGGLYSTADDLSVWLTAQLRAEKGGAVAIPAAALRESHAPFATLKDEFAGFNRTGYGLGWYSGPYDGAILYHAFGSFSGFRAHVSFMPDRDLGVAVVSNDEAIGFKLTDIVAAYAYDWYGHGAAYAAKRGQAALAELDALETAFPQQVADDRKMRAGRPWTLSLPKAAYAGQWCSPTVGRIDIETVDDSLIVRSARLSGIAQAYTTPESLRIELAPNSGEVMTFTVEGKQVKSLAFKDGKFTHDCPAS